MFRILSQDRHDDREDLKRHEEGFLLPFHISGETLFFVPAETEESEMRRDLLENPGLIALDKPTSSRSIIQVRRHCPGSNTWIFLESAWNRIRRATYFVPSCENSIPGSNCGVAFVVLAFALKFDGRRANNLLRRAHHMPTSSGTVLL